MFRASGASVAALIALEIVASEGRAQGACASTAAVHIVAEGWPGAAGVPQLTVLGAPVVGGPHVTALVSDAPALVPGLLLLGVELQPVTLPSGATVALANPLVAAPVVTDALGSVLLDAAPFTMIDPYFCGAEAFVQVALVDAQVYGGWSLTPCVKLQFGGPPMPLAQRLPMPSWPVAHNPYDVMLADVTGDGLADIVAADAGEYGVSPACATRVAQGGGDYEPRIALELPDVPRELAAGDLDGDGDADLVAARQGPGFPQPDSVLVLLSNGDGSLLAGDTELTAYGAHEPVLGDLDDDGALDAVVMNRFDDTISVCAGGGDGTLAAAVTFASLAEWPTQPALADVDLDGRLDLSLIFDDPDTNPDLVAIHLGLGDGTFAAPLTQPTLGERPRDLAVSDLSGDGLPELVTANTKGKTVTVMINSGGATFPIKLVYPNAESVTGYVGIGDVDADGLPDVAVAKPGPNELGFRHGHGNGSLGAEQTWSLNGTGSSSPVVADIDGDGSHDLGWRAAGSLHALTGDGPGDMAEAEVFSLGTHTVYKAVAVDFDHDGLDDLAYAGPWGLWVAHALGDGAFAPASVFFTDTVLLGLAVGDVDANGFEDVAGFGSPHSVLLLNGGAMGFVEAPPLPAPGAADFSTHGRFGDFDADGALDVVETWWYESEISVLRGVGTGSFQLAAAVDPFGPPDRSVEAGDYDDDGLDDLAVADGNPFAALRILAGDGSFGFSEVFAWDICAAVDVADGLLDADAVEDVVVVTACAALDAEAAGNVFVVRGAADRQFTLTPVANTILAVTEAVLEDIDLDGNQDLVCNASSKVGVLAGDAQGGFGSPQFFGLTPLSVAIAAGDFDGDGFPDLVQAGIFTWGIDFPKNARLLRHRHP